MLWIRKDYDSMTHLVVDRFTVQVADGEWKWRATTACGRTIIGLSGGSAYGPECKRCQRSLDGG